ncbi:MAG: PKD domain-containing protein [Candidatus Bathyarchaeota archaeon]|nr:PKD domain-containing protein [Candidatus Bathyarchaeota archaeon]
MKKRFLPLILVSLLLITGLPVALSEPVFESDSYADDVSDGVDFNTCFTGNMLVPTPMSMDVVTVTFTMAETLDAQPILVISSTLASPPLPHESYTFEYGFDIDNDPNTGANESECFYNGLGVDYDIGLEVFMGSIEYTWIDKYEEGEWVNLDSPDAYVDENTVTVEFPIDTFGLPLNTTVMVYLINEGGLDMAPEYGEPPLVVQFYHLPEAHVEPVTVDEGTPFELDASASVSLNGPVVLYEWDLDGDGIYEESHQDSILPLLYPDDGVHMITLKVTDEEGFSDIDETTITILNTPPYATDITYVGELIEGEELTFTGTAMDLGDDELTFMWEFGDGETAEGPEVTHSFSVSGEYSVRLSVTDDDGDEATESKVINIETPTTTEEPTTTEDPTTPTGETPVDEEPEPEPRIDPLLIVLVAIFGIGGWFIYNFITKGAKKPPKKKEEEDKEKDFCEEHPEIVEAEEKACWDAQMDLDSTVGDIQDQYDDALPRWQANAADMGRLITEWDANKAMINYWTGVEEGITEDAESVQEIAGIVSNAAGKAKTILEEGGEAALKEFAEDKAKEIGKSVLGDISSTIGQVLELEGWAVRTIGLGIAKGLTGVDPKGNAVNLRKKADPLMGDLVSWVSHSEAWNSGRRPPDTVDSCIDETTRMLGALDDALKNFEDAVKDFVCITCEIPEHIQQEIDTLRKNLEKWKDTFEKLKEEIEKRLEEAKALFRKKELYESPYEYLDKAQDNIDRVNRALNR